MPTIESKPQYRNVGWSLGNDCPLKCVQCYSRVAREKGANLATETVDRIVAQLTELGVRTVNLGGNEPIYTNGLDPRQSLLPYIIDSLVASDIKVGITSAGTTILALERFFSATLEKINDVDISLDSPIPQEHDQNRGQRGIFRMAMEATRIVKKHGIPRSFIMCAMNWNFTEDRIVKLIELAEQHEANVRFNPIKPTERKHMALVLSPQQFYRGLEVVLRYCDPIDLSDPSWASSVGVTKKDVSGSPCGTSSFRIHSITPQGAIPVSPCVYLHDFKVGDLTTQSLRDILNTRQFQLFRMRAKNPKLVQGCADCKALDVCGGGCAARTYLHGKFTEGSESIFGKDPYCSVDYAGDEFGLPQAVKIEQTDHQFVHKGYLCTGIFVLKDNAPKQPEPQINIG